MLKMRKMKASGIEWIGEIPEGWEITKLKYLATFPIEKNAHIDSPYIGLENIESWTGKYVSSDSQYDKSQALTFSRNNILFGKLRPYLAKVFFASNDGCCSSEFCILNFSSSVNIRYFWNLLVSPTFIDHVTKSTYGTKMPRANTDFIKNICVPVPPHIEQDRIALYLDATSAKIDSLISKTRSSIEEYKKLKQAVITQAVTKGVRGEREMKDTGVEWIGEIPEEWNKCKLKNISIDIGDGLHGTPKFDDSGEVYFINGNNFSSEYVEPKFDTKKLCLEESLNYPKPELTEQTIMISLNGSYGKVCLYRYFPMLLGKSAGYITLLPSINRRYVRYYLSSTPAQIIMTLSLNGTTIPNLSLNTLYNFPTILPSASEQAEIADYLDAKCAEIDGLIAKKEQLAKELESYKKSLIYEVVTGKREV